MIRTLVFITVLFTSFCAGAESSYIKQIKLEEQVFSFQGINLGEQKKTVLAKLGNCVPYKQPNWHYICDGKNTYLLAFNHGSLKSFRVFLKISKEDQNALIRNINTIYGPPNIIERKVTRPYQGSLNESERTPEWKEFEPYRFVWNSNQHEDYKELDQTLEMVIGINSFRITSFKGDTDFYDEGPLNKMSQIILDRKTDFEIGINKAISALSFIFMVFAFRYFFKFNIENNKISIINFKYYFSGTLKVLIFSYIFSLVFHEWGYMFELQKLGFFVVLSTAGFIGLYLAAKKSK